MNKDELIADLRQQVATLSRLLEMALDKQPPIIERSAAAIRQQKYRDKRNEASQRHITRDVTTVTEGTIGVEYPVSSGEDHGDVVLGEDGGETPKGVQGENVTPVTLCDADDPEWDAFRAAYPKLTRRTNWPRARGVWMRLSKANRALAVIGARNYAGCRDVLRGCEMTAVRWLNEQNWDRWQEPEMALPLVGKHAPDFSGILEFDRFLASKEAGA